MDVSAKLNLLESALLATKDKLSPENFATVCSVVAFDDASEFNREDFTLRLPHFLHANLSNVEAWLVEDAFAFDMQDFVNVAAAYLSMFDQGEIPEKLHSLLEKTVERNALNLDAQQAIHLAQVFAETGSSYTMEIFDRIIGANIEDIPVFQVFDAFMAFSTVGRAQVRPKIQNILLRTLADNLDQLLPSQLIGLCRVILAGKDAQSQARGSDLIKGLEIDKFLTTQLGALDEHDLVFAMETFADSSLLEVQQAIDIQLV